MSLDDQRDTSTSDSNEHNRYGEECYQGKLPLQLHVGAHYDGDWEDDQENVGYDVGGAHSEQVSIALPAFGPWIRDDLPVVTKWLAFGECRNEYGDECDEEKYADSL